MYEKIDALTCGTFKTYNQGMFIAMIKVELKLNIELMCDYR